IRQEVYRTLAQAYEEARIQEVRNTPVLTIVDPPEGSALPAIRLRLLAMLVLPVSALIVVAFVLVLEYLRQERAAEIQRLADAVARSGNRAANILVPRLARRLVGASGGSDRGAADRDAQRPGA